MPYSIPKCTAIVRACVRVCVSFPNNVVRWLILWSDRAECRQLSRTMIVAPIFYHIFFSIYILIAGHSHACVQSCTATRSYSVRVREQFPFAQCVLAVTITSDAAAVCVHTIACGSWRVASAIRKFMQILAVSILHFVVVVMPKRHFVTI